MRTISEQIFETDVEINDSFEDTVYLNCIFKIMCIFIILHLYEVLNFKSVKLMVLFLQ